MTPASSSTPRTSTTVTTLFPHQSLYLYLPSQERTHRHTNSDEDDDDEDDDGGEEVEGIKEEKPAVRVK